jgi:arylsulfatase A-like enzyme
VTANKLSGPEFGMAQGFQSAGVFPASEPVRARAEVVTRRAVRWLQRNSDRPFFLYVHYLDPHDPYAPPRDFNRFAADPPPGLPAAVLRGKTGHGDLIRSGRATLSSEALAHLRSLYDGEIRYTDHYVGRLLAELRRLGIAGRTTVVFTADHGEEFLEHGGLKHAATLYREVLDVPLIIRDPGRVAPGKRVRNPVLLSDLAATILAALGVEAPPGMGGANLLDPAALPADRPLYGEMMASPDQPVTTERGQGKRSIALDRWKLIRNLHTGRDALYDLALDPAEERDRQCEMPDVADDLAARLDRFMAEGDTAEGEDRAGPTDAQRRMLKELGYLQ